MEEIDLKELILFFWKKKLIIISLAVIFMILGFIYSAIIVLPKYTASTTLLLVQASTTNNESTSITTTDITLNSKLIATYSKLITSNKVIRQVIANLGIEDSEESIKNSISVTAESGTDILKITVNSTNPQKAADIANEIAKIFPEEIKQYYGLDNIDVVDLAEVNTEPYNINHKKKAIIFGSVGAVIAVVYLFIAYSLDNSIKSDEDVERITRNASFSKYPDI